MIDSKSVELAETAAALARSEGALLEARQEVDELNSSRDRQQAAHDRELNELRTQLGAEMVSAHEARSRLATLAAEHADLRTRAAVLEEQCRAGRADVERIERERDELRGQTARLREEHAAAAAAAAEARARGDAAAAQHAEAVRSFLSSQVPSKGKRQVQAKETGRALSSFRVGASAESSLAAA